MTTTFQLDTHVDLTAYNTMGLSSTADTFINVYNESQIEQVVSEFNTQYTDSSFENPALFILSGGSNVLLPKVLHTTVIRPLLKGINVIDEDNDKIEIEVFAGENWHDLVEKTVNNGWYGLENLALIPGLTGAAPVQNIGAYGVQLEDRLSQVKAYHLPTLTWHTFDKNQCQFEYRNSLFKQQIGDWLITRVRLFLHKDAYNIQASYGDVEAEALKLAHTDKRNTITAKDVMGAIIKIRQTKLPDPAILPNCGSFFKNPIIPTAQFNALKNSFADIVGYCVTPNEKDKSNPSTDPKLIANQTKIAAGWLIDHAGLKGAGIHPILTHDKQALVLTNHADKLNTATQQSIAATQTYIQNAVYKKYGIMLEREPLWINENGKIVF